MRYDKIDIPALGDAITLNNDHSLNVPDKPVMLDVATHAVQRAYDGTRGFGAAVMRHMDD